MQVNLYGVIYFGSRDLYNSYPRPFPLSTSDNIIAPFWDYFHYQNGGQILFRLSDNQALLNDVGSTINDTLEFGFSPTMLFIVTWDEIPKNRDSQNNIVRATLTINAAL